MIVIRKPQIVQQGGDTYLLSTICSEKENIKHEVWYRTTEEWAQYLTDEVADAFVLPMLLVALRNQEEIVVEAPLSEKLYYNIVNNVLYTLSIPLHVNHKLRIKCGGLAIPNFRPFAVGCGCSLGVDSFSAMIRHMSDDCPKSFRITHLTNFNVGAYGNDFEKAEVFYQDSLRDVKEYVQEKEMPLVTLESNFGVFFKGVNFNWCGPVRTMSAVLAMQKLFKRYYYAVGSTNKAFKFTTTMNDFASLIIPLFSTENTEFNVADQDKTRIEKTISIVDDFYAQKYLDVCWKKVWANNRGRTDLLEIPFRNCTRCGKCIRTLLTIDAMGCLDKFSGIFDVEYFKSHKNEIVSEYIRLKDVDHYHREVYDFLVENKYPMPVIRESKRIVLKVFLKKIKARLNK